MLLGSGELGKEFTIAAKRAGQYVIACDKYDNAPAMQVADEREVVVIEIAVAQEGQMGMEERLEDSLLLIVLLEDFL
jgi:formate-dependent phosphoribosylglycinamide formyltransferase (GAR transformylase)